MINFEPQTDISSGTSTDRANTETLDVKRARSLLKNLCEFEPTQIKDRQSLMETLNGLKEAITLIVAVNGVPDTYGYPNRFLTLPVNIETYPGPTTDVQLVKGRLLAGTDGASSVYLRAEILTGDEQVPSLNIDIPTIEQLDKYPSAANAYDFRGREDSSSLSQFIFPFDDEHGQDGDIEKYFKILQGLCSELLEKTDLT